MNRYILKFEKKAALRYTSHLDLLRLFRRTFKRAGVELQYSRGFNPHPKMSFAQPLSLGYTSEGEYLEFETVIPYNEDMITGLMNSLLPYGIRVLECRPITDNRKSTAALIRYASYAIRLPDDFDFPSSDHINEYMSQREILIDKPVKKRKEIAQVDIKPMIKTLKTENDSQGTPFIFMEIHAGSQSNLNPELLLNSLFNFCGLAFEKGEIEIKRLELYQENGLALY